VRERLKAPRKGSEIDPETVCLQAVKARRKAGDGVTIEELSGELIFVARLRNFSSGAEAKASLNRAISRRD
jgi:hypothetical protein